MTTRKARLLRRIWNMAVVSADQMNARKAQRQMFWLLFFHGSAASDAFHYYRTIAVDQWWARRDSKWPLG